MSLTGISRAKNSASIFVDNEKRGMANSSEYSSAYSNVEYTPTLSYTNSKSLIRTNSSISINVIQNLSHPAVSYVNLGFAFANVSSSSSQRQLSDSFIGNESTLTVDNNLSYSYTNNVVAKNNISTKTINVLSTNEEHSITIDLDNKALPEVETFYQNYEVANDIELDEDDIWS